MAPESTIQLWGSTGGTAARTIQAAVCSQNNENPRCAHFCAHHQTRPSTIKYDAVAGKSPIHRHLSHFVAVHHDCRKLLILRARRLRRQTLYPTELRARCAKSLEKAWFSKPMACTHIRRFTSILPSAVACRRDFIVSATIYQSARSEIY